MDCTICALETSPRLGFSTSRGVAGAWCLPWQVRAGDPGRAGSSGVGDLAVAHKTAEMVSGVAALPGCLRQREGGLVPLPERGLELGRAALERDGRSVAPVPAERLGLRPPGGWQGLDGCTRRSCASVRVHSQSPSASLRSASVRAGSPSPRRTERSARSTRRPRSASPAGACDGVDGGRNGCECERQVQGEQDAVFGEEERPIRREVFEARPGEQHGRPRDGGGEAGADFPGLHGGLLP